MSAETIRLHEVDSGQGLPADGLNRLRAQRLNCFPGRALGEDEFDRLQAWGDARIAALEGAMPAPGIVSGLGCRLERQDGEPVIRVEPGVGLGRGHELHSLNSALTRGWTGLRDAFRARPDSPDAALSGLYLVVLDAEFFHLDVNPDQAPCRRDEPDRLRDARIARGLVLHLAAVDPALWTLDEVEQQPLTAANRFLGGLLAEPLRMPAYGGVAVALIGVRDDALLWLDAAAGAFPAVEQPIHAQLRGHLHRAFEQVLAAGLRAGDTPLAALQSFTPAYLPAAAELPSFLLANPAGVNPLPRLDWFPPGAALDLQVLPESSLPVVLGANLNRAATPFGELAGDRYRIGLVLADRDHRDGLLALPRLDAELPDLLRRQGILARNAAADLQDAWDALAAGFDQEANADVKVPPRPIAAEHPEQVLKALGDRDWLAKQANASLEAPYSTDWPAAGNDLPEAKPVRDDPPDDIADGLLARAAAEQAEQERLDEMLADIDALLELLEQEKKQGRGLVDTLTIDLAQLAGGIAGDGSGLRIASIARQVDMAEKQSGDG
jgi:hypothetical protein